MALQIQQYIDASKQYAWLDMCYMRLTILLWCNASSRGAAISHLLVEVGAVELLGRHVHGRPIVVGRAQVALRRVLHPADAKVRHLPHRSHVRLCSQASIQHALMLLCIQRTGTTALVDAGLWQHCCMSGAPWESDAVMLLMSQSAHLGAPRGPTLQQDVLRLQVAVHHRRMQVRQPRRHVVRNLQWEEEIIKRPHLRMC